MRKLLIAAAVICLPLILAGQDVAQQIKDFNRLLQVDGVALSLVHLNDKTVPLLFEPPTLYAIRARAKEATALFVQGVMIRNAELDTTTFTIEQGGMSSPGMPTSIHNFTKGKLKLSTNDHVDGVLTFGRLVDVAKPFTVKHGKDMVEFKFTADQVKAMTPPAPPTH